jgi:uncharacterized OB-fold protein
MRQIRKGVYPVPLKDPYADATVQPFWDNALGGRLSASRCKHCGTFHLPPQPFCFACQHRNFEWIELPGTGTIYTYTVVRHPLRAQLTEVVPYVAGIIELDGTQGAGARMQANIVNCDPEKIRIGDKVRVVFDQVSDTLAVTRFEPIS